MPTSIFRPAVPLVLFAALTACRRERDQQARADIHDAGFSYSVADFLRAAREGKSEIVGQFLKAGMNPDALDESGVTAIAGAAAAGQGHVVDLLLAAGAKPNAAKAQGQTALMAAAGSGDERAVKALLAAGADPQAKDGAGLSPLGAAVLAGQASTVALLSGVSAAALDDSLQLAALKGHTTVLSVLMDRGASPLTCSGDGRTAMMFAAEYGHMEAVKLLRQRGGCVTALDRELKTPANHAEENGFDDIAAYLRAPDYTADPIEPERSPERATEFNWSGGYPEPASLESLASAMQMIDYRPATLPLVVVAVTEDNTAARLRLAKPNEESITVAAGESVPGTTWTVFRMQHRLISPKQGPGKVVDASEVLLKDTTTERHHLAVKGLPVTTGEPCALVRFHDSMDLVELRRGDSFQAGAIPVTVAEIRPLKIELERTDTKATATVNRPANP